MTAASGLGLVEVLALEAMAAMGATADGRFVKSARLLERFEEVEGVAPAFGYRALVLGGRPTAVALPIVDFAGNAGTEDFEAADPRYTEVRLSPVGALALACERGETAPLPIGLINGTMHLDGRRPPFAPTAVLDAVVAAADGADGTDLARLIGAPVFPTGCAVDGDFAALHAGFEMPLRLTARIEPHPERPSSLWVTALPLGVGPGALNLRDDDVRALGVYEFSDETDWRTAGVRIRLSASDYVDRDAVAAELRELWPYQVVRRARLGASSATLLRGIVGGRSADEMRNDLGPLRALVVDGQKLAVDRRRRASMQGDQ